MNNSRCLPTSLSLRNSLIAGAAALVLVSTSGTAMAQSQSVVQPPVVTTSKPVAPTLIPLKPANVGPVPTPQNDGFNTPAPTVGANDPAERMSLSGEQSALQGYTSAADDRLANLTGTPLSGQETSDLKTMMDIKRSNMLLQLKTEQATLAVGLWGELFNNEHVQAWRQKESQDAEARAKAQADAEQTKAAALAQTSPSSASMPWPVVAELNGSSALLLVPNAGEIYVRKGTALPDGMRVVSVGPGGVVVDQNGAQVTLGFGTSLTVPAASSSNTTSGQPAPAVTYVGN